MGEELDTPIKEYQPKDNENKFLKYGLNRVQGWKKSMEDFTLDFAEKEPEKLQNIFGIFDGHGGTEVPKYLSENFFQFLKNNENFKIGKYKEALTETFFELDKSFTTKETQKLLSKYSEELKENYCSEYRLLNKELRLLSEIGYKIKYTIDIYPPEANRWDNTHFYAIVAEK